MPAGALCSRSFSLELSLSNAAGSSAWVQYAGGHAVEMPPCRGSPPEAPAFSGVALEGGALVVKLQPLKPSVQGAGSAGELVRKGGRARAPAMASCGSCCACWEPRPLPARTDRPGFALSPVLRVQGLAAGCRIACGDITLPPCALRLMPHGCPLQPTREPR